MAVAFKSAARRREWQSMMLVTLLHMALAVGVGAVLTRDGGELWIVSGLTYAAFIAVSLLWWISRQAVAWLVWRLLWRRLAVNDLVAEFQKARLPPPDSILPSADNYFESIVNDDQQSVAVRMAAAAHYLRLAEFAPQQGFLTAVRLAGVYEEAVAAYRPLPA